MDVDFLAERYRVPVERHKTGKFACFGAKTGINLEKEVFPRCGNFNISFAVKNGVRRG